MKKNLEFLRQNLIAHRGMHNIKEGIPENSLKAFEKANGVTIRYSIKSRRPGDIATCYCNPMKAKEELNWVAKYGIEDMCRDSWNWQKQNPNGY